jgi:hypothetical protein
MRKHLGLVNNIVIALQAFLLILCFVDLSAVPEWIRFGGKFHPLLLHLPVTMILLLVPFSFLLRRYSEDEKVNLVFSTLLSYTALFATFAAMGGLFLAAGDEYDRDTLALHKWFGVGIAFASHALIYLNKTIASNKLVWNLALYSTVVIMGVGSHFGGTLTHGEGYLSFSSESKPTLAVPEFSQTTTVYDGAIQPILEAKCVSCHNDGKSKGGLNMAGLQALLKGGKSGATWVAGDPDKSLLIERILLDMDDKKHMPPKGRSQLSSNEITLFREWIRAGADPKTTYHALAETDSLKKTVATFIAAASVQKAAKTYAFPAASASKISSLNTPFRRILPLASSSPALSVKFYLKEKFELNMLSECKSISTQVVDISLSNMPADDKAITLIKGFEHLERLNLNGTSITGKNLGELKANKNLEQLSLASTTVDKSMLDALATLPSLKQVFLWNTKVTEADAAELRKKYPTVLWDLGYVPDKNEILKLTPPQFVDDDKRIYGPAELIAFKHPMPGVQIRYTVDGSKPDSVTGMLYQKPFPATGLMRIRAIATNPGWLTSDTTDNTFFLKGFKPDSISLYNDPNPRYKSSGSAALTDLVKGEPGNLGINWLGYKDSPFRAGIHFPGNAEIKQIFISTAENTDQYVMPAEKIVIRGGDSPQQMKVLGTIKPEQPKENRRNRLVPFVVPIEQYKYRYIEIEAIPVGKMPAWHRGKGDKGWVFVDELFFY